MNPFVDFNKIKKSQIKEIVGVVSSQTENSHQEALLKLTMEEFTKFVSKSMKAVHEKISNEKIENIFQVSPDYNPEENSERFLKDVWGNHSKFWILIEPMTTYYITMMSIIEKLTIPEGNHIRVASLGSGPGIYETFLAKFLSKMGIGSYITCVDFAPEMTEMHKFIMSLENPPLRNIEPITGNMASIPLPDQSVDAVICNNSLQWCIEWKKAIAEMARVLERSDKSWAYVIVHLHKQAMSIRTSTGERPVDMQPILVEQIMDELEKNMFTLVSSRQLRSGNGGGQAGGTMDRVLLKAQFTPNGPRGDWRKAKKTMEGARFMKASK